MPNHKTYIIAEAGVNHNGSLVNAKKLVDIASKAGADAVKFQTFKAENLVNIHAPQAEYQAANIGKRESQFDMLKRLELKEDMHFELAEYCKQRNITFLSTPFDNDSLDFLVKNFEMPLIKIGSGEVTNAPFLLEIAKTGKDIILSTGMSDLEEVEQALSVLAFGYLTPNKTPSIEAFNATFKQEDAKNILMQKVQLLHCTTEYPCPLEDVNLKAMHTMQKAFGLDVGYSDHTAGIDVSLAAVAMGAKIIEKHFTIDKTMEGPDHKASLEPNELIELVKEVRRLEQLTAQEKQSFCEEIKDIKSIKGSGIKSPSHSEQKNIPIARKSIIAKQGIKKGEVFSKENLCIKRPGNGLKPIKIWQLYGKKSPLDIKADELVSKCYE